MLSGFELYPHWVPLFLSTYVYIVGFQLETENLTSIVAASVFVD